MCDLRPYKLYISKISFLHLISVLFSTAPRKSQILLFVFIILEVNLSWITSVNVVMHRCTPYGSGVESDEGMQQVLEIGGHSASSRTRGNGGGSLVLQGQFHICVYHVAK